MKKKHFYKKYLFFHWTKNLLYYQKINKYIPISNTTLKNIKKQSIE